MGLKLLIFRHKKRTIFQALHLVQLYITHSERVRLCISPLAIVVNLFIRQRTEWSLVTRHADKGLLAELPHDFESNFKTLTNCPIFLSDMSPSTMTSKPRLPFVSLAQLVI